MQTEKLTCIICEKNTTYKVTKKASTCSHGFVHPEIIHSDDKRRVSQKLCVRCFKKELIIQLYDEVGGILGNLEYTGENTLVALSKALVLHKKTRYYGASEYQVFKALKDNQDEEQDILMIPDGDVDSLKRKLD